METVVVKQLVLVSGRSGSGKSIALKVLEDLGFYAIDNLPLHLLSNLLQGTLQESRVAVGVDARSLSKDWGQFRSLFGQVRERVPMTQVLYLDAADQVLLRRFSETRRRHPLTRFNCTLQDAIADEHVLLMPIAGCADVTIDTSNLNAHGLSVAVRSRFEQMPSSHLQILLQSFGYKRGLPADADFVFDVRCLPNPYWDADLRPLTGKDEAVVRYFEEQDVVQRMLADILQWFKNWLPCFEADHRSYLTLACGCTGGRHRSVYLVERISHSLKAHLPNHTIHVRHRDLE